jgi:hypothetical protein
MKKAGTPSAKQGGAGRQVKPWRMQFHNLAPSTDEPIVVCEDEPVAVVRSLHSVGGTRPGKNTKRKRRMARKAGYASFEQMQTMTARFMGLLR